MTGANVLEIETARKKKATLCNLIVVTILAMIKVTIECVTMTHLTMIRVVIIIQTTLCQDY